MPPAEHNPPMFPLLQAQTRPFVPPNTVNFLNDVCKPELSLADLAKRYSTTVDALSVWLSRPDVVQRLAEIRSVSAQRAGFIAGMHLPSYTNSLADSLKQAIAESDCLKHFTLTVESNTVRVRYRENIRKTVALLANIARFERTAARWAKPVNPKPKDPKPTSPPPPPSPPPWTHAPRTPTGSPHHSISRTARPQEREQRSSSSVPNKPTPAPTPSRGKLASHPPPHRAPQPAKQTKHSSPRPVAPSTRAPTPPRTAISARRPTSQSTPRSITLRARTDSPQRVAPPSKPQCQNAARRSNSARQINPTARNPPSRSLPGPAP